MATKPRKAHQATVLRDFFESLDVRVKSLLLLTLNQKAKEAETNKSLLNLLIRERAVRNGLETNRPHLNILNTAQLGLGRSKVQLPMLSIRSARTS
jgi:hypothetical protein